MFNNSKKAIEKRGYEIVYSLFRISANLNRQPLGGYLENHALSLFDSAVYLNKESAIAESKIIEYYLRLGGDLGLIHSENAEVLIREIAGLNSAIAELGVRRNKLEPLKLPIAEFGNVEIKMTSDIQKKEVSSETVNKEIEAISNIEEDILPIEMPEEKTGSPESANSLVRQSAILDKIRQFKNCRTKELQELFPDISTRTLRYDLEKLMEKGLVERLGQSGPATSYVVRKA